MKPTLLVMAAGLGSRYGGVKQIDSLGVHGETLLDYSTYDAAMSGFGKVVYIIRPDIEKDFRERLFDRVSRNIDAEYVFQTQSSLLSAEEYALVQGTGRTKPWGTVHAVLCAKDAIKEPFAVINADDYYGRGAYKVLGDYLSGLRCDSNAYAMVGYKLKNTMSLSGSVSRGVCKVNDEGFLSEIVENTRIEYQGDRIVSHLEDGDVYLTGEEYVSMNLFGFTPLFFDYLQGYFERFLSENVCELKKECLLPSCVGEAVHTGAGSVKVFSTNESWFGVTYKEDKALVNQNLKDKTNAGVYPLKLWEK